MSVKIKSLIALILCISSLFAIVSCDGDLPDVDINTSDSSNEIEPDVPMETTDINHIDPPESTDEVLEWTSVDYNVYGMANNIVVYSEANVNSLKLGEVNIADEMLAKALSASWYKVSYNNGTGYIQKKYVTANSQEPIFNSYKGLKAVMKEDVTDIIVLYNNPAFTTDGGTVILKREDTLSGQFIIHTANKEGNILLVEYNSSRYYMDCDHLENFDRYSNSSGDDVIDNDGASTEEGWGEIHRP